MLHFVRSITIIRAAWFFGEPLYRKEVKMRLIGKISLAVAFLLLALMAFSRIAVAVTPKPEELVVCQQ
jgi:hypothetical protein